MQLILTGKKSIYEEITDLIRRYIEAGVFAPGEQLPSVRELAVQLSINPNTVAHAYEALTEEGIVVSIPKKGYFVSAGERSPSRKMLLKNLLKDELAEGMTIADIKDVVEEIEKEGNIK
jgi:GntR family transcriptional regulator